MRIWCLVFVLALVLSGNSTKSWAAIGGPARCNPPAPSKGKMKIANAKTLLFPEPQQPLGLDLEQRDYLIRTIAFEASGETEQGKAAVAHVILNRKRIGRWGDNIKNVVTHPWQFEPWMTKRRQIESLASDDARFRSAARIADAVLAGEMPDPTAGATHFLNPVIVRNRRGGSLPRWARGGGRPIGRHTFYALLYNLAVPDSDGRYLHMSGDQLACGRPDRSLGAHG